MQLIPKITLALAIISNTLLSSTAAAPTAQMIPLGEKGGSNAHTTQCHSGGSQDAHGQRESDCASLFQSRQMYGGDVESRQISPSEAGNSGKMGVSAVHDGQCCSTGEYTGEHRQVGQVEDLQACARCRPGMMSSAPRSEGPVESRQILHAADNPEDEDSADDGGFEKRQILHAADGSGSTDEET